MALAPLSADLSPTQRVYDNVKLAHEAATAAGWRLTGELDARQGSCWFVLVEVWNGWKWICF
jgi:hypothetical protein